MKLFSKDGIVTVQAETIEDVKTLFALGESTGRKHKPHKKHAFMKECPGCGKQCKGLRGLGIHRAKCLVPPIKEQVSPVLSSHTPLARSYEM